MHESRILCADPMRMICMYVPECFVHGMIVPPTTDLDQETVRCQERQCSKDDREARVKGKEPIQLMPGVVHYYAGGGCRLSYQGKMVYMERVWDHNPSDL